MNALQYLQLNKGGTPARLAILRGLAAYTNAPDVNLPPSRRFASWKEARKYGFQNWRAAHGAGLFQGGGDSNLWYTHTGEYFRDERYADDVVSIGHTGWFTDDYCSDKIRGIVGRLPHGKFIAGYCSSVNDERVYYNELFDCEREAAFAADRYAEDQAEVESEHNAVYHRGLELQDEIEDSLIRLRECIALRHQKCMSYIRDEISGLVESIRDKRQELSENPHF